MAGNDPFEDLIHNVVETINKLRYIEDYAEPVKICKEAADVLEELLRFEQEQDETIQRLIKLQSKHRKATKALIDVFYGRR